MPEQKLDLIQFAAGKMAQTGTSAAKVMRSNLLDTCTSGSLPNDFPNHLRRHSITPDPSGSIDGAKQCSLFNTARLQPVIDCHFYPARNRDGADMAIKSAMTQCSSRT